DAGYGVSTGSSIAPVTIPNNLSSTINDSTLQGLVQAWITAGTVSNPNSQTLYVIYIEPGVEVIKGNENSANNFYAYHSGFAGKDHGNNNINIQYSITPYPGSPNLANPNLSNNLDRITKSTSHEIAEAATDPGVWSGPTLAWYDDVNDGENGDIE